MSLVWLPFIYQTDVPEQPTLGAFMKQEFNPVTWKAWGKLHEAILVPPSSSKDETTSIGNAIPFKVRSKIMDLSITFFCEMEELVSISQISV